MLLSQLSSVHDDRSAITAWQHVWCIQYYLSSGVAGSYGIQAAGARDRAAGVDEGVWREDAEEFGTLHAESQLHKLQSHVIAVVLVAQHPSKSDARTSAFDRTSANLSLEYISCTAKIEPASALFACKRDFIQHVARATVLASVECAPSS